MNKIFEYAMIVNTTLQGNLMSKSLSASQGLSKLAKEAKRLAETEDVVRQKMAGLQNQIDLNRNAKQQLLNLQRQGVGNSTRLANSLQQLDSQYIRLKNSMKPYEAELAKTLKLQQQNKQSQLMGNMQSARGKVISSFIDMSATMAAISSIASPLTGMISTAADYESAMSKVQSITGATGEGMERLKATASKLGATTMFSAKQSADAMSYLGMAGWKTEQIIAGMPGLLDLAAASGADLATVADIVSDDLTAFGMSADQAGRMADVMAAASSNANTNVEMMGATFKYAASVAGSLGYSLEDVSLATGLMANAGIKGEQAGTSLRAVMTRLASPPKAAAAAMDQLGISITNTDGTMKPLMQVMEECRSKFAGLNEEEKAQAASAIAGQEAMSGWLAIMNASDEDFTKLSTAINNSDGAAKKMADTMQDNAQGALTRLQSAMESISIAVGSAVLPVLADLTDKVAAVAGEIGEWAQAHPTIMAISVALAGAAGAAIIAFSVFGFIADSILAIQAAWAVFETTSAGASLAGMLAPLSGILAIGWPLVAVIGAIAAVAAVLYANWDTVCEVATIVTDKISAAWEQTKERLQPTFDKISEAFGRLIEIFGGMGEGSSVVSSILNTLGALIVGIVDMALDCFATLIEVIGTVLDTAVTVFGNILDFVGNVFTGNWQGAWDNIKNIFGAVFEGIYDIASNIFGRIIDRISGVAGAVADFLGIGGGGGGDDISSNASGGIYRKGAFLTTFAEESPEAAIPLDGSRRAISLWQQAGQMLGMLPYGSEPSLASRALDMASGIGGSVSNTNNNSNQSISISIPVTVNGNADGPAISSMQSSIEAAIRRALADIRHQEGRVSFA